MMANSVRTARSQA